VDYIRNYCKKNLAVYNAF